jgi:hypothetical protein
MTDPVQLISIVVSGLLLLLVLELVRRRLLGEEYSFIWIGGAAVLLVLSIWRQSLDLVAFWLKIYYPPALLLLVLVFFVFIALLFFSIVASKHMRQIERLVEETAILDARLRELESRDRSGERAEIAPDDGGAS